MVIGLFTGGKERLVLPTWPYLALIATVSGAVYVLSTTSCQKISTRTKQLLCILLFAINLLLPLYIASPIFVLTILGELHLFNIVLRFSEVIYVQSLVYGKPAEISGAALSAEFASIMRLKTQDKSKAKRVPWYHLLVPISLYILLTNVIASWYTTFEGPEVIEIPHNSILYFIFFVFAVVIMTSVINAFGYFGLMVHVIKDEGGTFVQDEWRPLMDMPIIAPSLGEVWGRRWHQTFKYTWLAIPFRPVKVLSKPVIGNTAANILATISVFFVSGLMHEYLIICEVGTEAYFKRFVGQECFFFTIHGVAVLFERWFQQRFQIPSNLATRFLGHVWVIAFAFLTFPWFLDSFAYFGVWHANPFNTFVPYLIDNVWRKHPILRPFCGNLL